MPSEYEKNLTLHSLFSAEIKSLISLLQKHEEDSSNVLDALNQQYSKDDNCAEMFAKYDVFSRNLRHMVQQVRDFSKHLRENSLKPLINVQDKRNNDREASNCMPLLKFGTSEKEKHNYSREPLPAFVKTINLNNFVEGEPFEAWILHIDNFKKLTFYVGKYKNGLVISPDEALEFGTLSEPAEHKIFGIKWPHEEYLTRAVLPISKTRNDKVLLIDTGERIKINKEVKLYELPLKYQDMPAQAIYCKLLGITRSSITQNIKQQLCKILSKNENVRMLFKIRSVKENMLEVFILNSEPQNKTVTEKTDKNNALMIVPNIVEPKLESINPVSKPAEVTPSNNCTKDVQNQAPIFKVICTFVTSGNSFYGQIVSELKTNELVYWPEKNIPTSQRIFKKLPCIDELVLGLYLGDMHWYRAKILDIDEQANKYEVFYVDFGNKEILPLSCLANCLLSEKNQPFLAYHFRINEICPPKRNSSKYDESINALNALICDEVLNVCIVGGDQSTTIIDFIGEDSNIPQCLVGAGLAFLNQNKI